MAETNVRSDKRGRDAEQLRSPPSAGRLFGTSSDNPSKRKWILIEEVQGIAETGSGSNKPKSLVGNHCMKRIESRKKSDRKKRSVRHAYTRPGGESQGGKGVGK